MAAKMTLKGVYYYPDERALKRVLAAARGRLDEDYPRLAKTVRDGWGAFLVQEGTSLEVDVEVHGGDTHVDGLKALATTLAGRANGGDLELVVKDGATEHFGARMVDDDEEEEG